MSSNSDFEDNQDSESLFPIDEHEEIVSEGGKKIRRRGIYILPNLLTLGALFAGFFAVISGMTGNFDEAGWAILIAAILDGLDGRIARMTNTQSAFGAQFDSLSDMVSFGMAPALIVFSWALAPLGNIGWAASFIFMSCAAMRLARFNVQLGTVSKRYFVGLQSPLAAGLVTFVPWVAYKHGVEVTEPIRYAAAVLTVFAGLLMISNYKYFSFKEIHVKGTVPFVVFICAVVLLVVIAQNPHEVLLTMCVAYSISGPILWAYKKTQTRKPAPVASKKAPGAKTADKGRKLGESSGAAKVASTAKAGKTSTKITTPTNAAGDSKDSEPLVKKKVKSVAPKKGAGGDSAAGGSKKPATKAKK